MEWDAVLLSVRRCTGAGQHAARAETWWSPVSRPHGVKDQNFLVPMGSVGRVAGHSSRQIKRPAYGVKSPMLAHPEWAESRAGRSGRIPRYTDIVNRDGELQNPGRGELRLSGPAA
jgi:hypothetical protein